MANSIPNPEHNFFVPAFFKMRKHQYLLTVGLMLLGALIAFFLSSFIKFKYEAESVLITNLELVENTNITEIMVDSQLELVRQLMFHPDITNAVLKVEQEAGNPLTLDQLNKMSQVERRLNSTYIKVRSNDPQIAARIATTWAKTAYERLSQAYQHALLVSEAQWTLTTIEDCLTEEILNQTYFCRNLNPEKVQTLTSESQAVLLAESANSLGLTKDIKISQFQPAAVPMEPVRGSRSSMILLAALAGLVFSLILYELPAFKSID